MIVRAIANRGTALPPSAIDKSRGFTERTEFPVTIGAEYPVYGVTLSLGIAWYYILDDNELRWPIWSPAPLFEVVDGRFPSSWIYGYVRGRDNDSPIISFPEWASDQWFYERLVDDEPVETEIFARRRLEVEELHNDGAFVDQVRAVLGVVCTQYTGPGSEQLLGQLDALTLATGEITGLRLHVDKNKCSPSEAPSPLPLDQQVEVIDGEGRSQGLFVLTLAGGFVDLLEYVYWGTAEPTTFPSVEMLRVTVDD